MSTAYAARSRPQTGALNSRVAVAVGGTLAAVAVAVGLIAALLVGPETPTPPDAAPMASPDSTAPVAAPPTPSPAPPPGPCGRAQKPFTPTSFTVPGVVETQVLALPRDSRGVPGVPSLDTGGKSVIAFDADQGVRPGDRLGNVLLNAHTWPDGTALGNLLLAQLHRGDRIVLRGERGVLCYRVTQRVGVLAADGYPPYYDRKGRPQIALIVCSGRRLGPGDWESRTIWFAEPEGSVAAKG